MRRVTLFMICIASSISFSIAQSGKVKPLLVMSSYGDWESCEAMKQHALQDYLKGDLQYVFYTQFIPTDDQMAAAIILRKQFNITATTAMIYCMGEVSPGLYLCYNEIVDSIMSRSLNRYFPTLLRRKADSLIKVMSPEALLHEITLSTQ